MENGQKKQIKVAIIGYKLADGGLERVFANLTNLLHENGVEVHTIILESKFTYKYSGKLLVLGKYSKFVKYFKLKLYLKKNKIPQVIDFRYRINPLMEFLFLNYIYAKTKIIYTVHSSNLEEYFTSNKWIAAKILKNKIIAVSMGIHDKIQKKYNYNQTEVIYNAISKFETNQVNEIPFKFIVAVGRLVKLKQFLQLIESYSLSELPKKDFHLVIVGNGPELNKIKAKVSALKLTDFVHLVGYNENPIAYISQAHFLVLTSLYEGFPMVLLEALSLGTPVVSFNCESGPNEIIQDNFNGILVENQNFDELIDKMNTFVKDTILYQKCKKNAIESVSKFQESEILNQWLQILINGN
ncbi:glycosyltransferase [Flavobacterium cucumis]|uniref:Glycosyltransferase involved in cell wall bisynthesis n=1 Tax=Flavobacterium cucumis TaxID=416016 RepID=A0A1M7ZW41_9FLAO|nr:glycosyltransferase [Flavobacterium cucumis]SHO73099.1 Glycosyltransferase involved in cell wall bisynthesis [Flavobacterium cucumis]